MRKNRYNLNSDNPLVYCLHVVWKPIPKTQIEAEADFMWLMYPIDAQDVRSVRRSILLLIAGSVIWYVSLILVCLAFGDVMWTRIHGKFVDMPPNTTTKLPLLALMSLYAVYASSRFLAYRMSRNVFGGLGVPESESWASAGVALSILSLGTINFGFTGLLALTAVAGAAMELKYMRFPATLFGMVVSPEAVRRVNLYFWVRTFWMALIVPTAMIFLIAHILTELPKTEGGIYEHQINTLNRILYDLFKGLSLLAVMALPVVLGMYYMILWKVYGSVERILDPNGPKVQPPEPPKPGFDQLKQVLQPQDW
jgi:hypothetical protein